MNPFTVIAAPNSLKESLSARETAAAIARGVKSAIPSATVHELPLADGGDGMLEAMLHIKKGKKKKLTVSDPLGKPVESVYGILEDGTAVIEMSLASGLHLVPPTKRNALSASSYGTGELILHAAKQGCRRFILGIGGSATTDGGAGAASALGFNLLDSEGKSIKANGAGLATISQIDDFSVCPEIKTSEFQIACDVSNSLLGCQGAASAYSPQKGATKKEVAILEKNLKRLADVIELKTGKTFRHLPGTGAAGGLGYFFISCLNATLAPGAKLILRECNFKNLINGSSLIITAEGTLDEQSAYGKLPAAVAAAGQKAGVPVAALCGILKPGWESLKNHGLTAAFAIAPGPLSQKESITNASHYLENAAREITALFHAGLLKTPENISQTFFTKKGRF